MVDFVYVRRDSAIHASMMALTAPSIFVIWFYLLVLYGAAYHLYQLAQFCYLLAMYALVDGIALDEILLQNLVGPLTELDTSFGVHTISHRNNHIEVEIWDGTGHLSASLHLNLCNFCTG